MWRWRFVARATPPRDQPHHQAVISGRQAAGGGGLHAERQLVFLPTAQARHPRHAARGGPGRDLLLPDHSTRGWLRSAAPAHRRWHVDEAYVIHDGDLLLVPEGYHTFAMAQGYTGYYLNILAGDEPVRTMQPSDDPNHAWVRETWNDDMNAGHRILAGDRNADQRRRRQARQHSASPISTQRRRSMKTIRLTMAQAIVHFLSTSTSSAMASSSRSSPGCSASLARQRLRHWPGARRSWR